MSRRNLTLLLLLLWAAAFVWSFVSTQITPATGDGFTRGMNRISGFAIWQALAFALAIGIWVLGGAFHKSTVLCRVSRVPAIAALLVVLGVLGIFAWNAFVASAPLGTSAAPPLAVTQ